MTQPTPHLTELLDLTDVVDASMLQYVRQVGHVPADVSDDEIRAHLDTRSTVDRQRLRTETLRILYSGARVIAEQAYARAWDRARQLVDERTGEADKTLGSLDSPGDSVPDDYELELNPFAEGAVTV